MDDHPPTVSQDSSSADAEPLLDSVTAELKAEFARLEQARRFDDMLRELEVLIGPPKQLGQVHSLSQALEKIRRTLEGLHELAGTIGYVPPLRQKVHFWTAAFRVTKDALAKLQALLAHSLQATFRTPLLLDGPELSGYKHRLR
jgi:hypothetical protein